MSTFDSTKTQLSKLLDESLFTDLKPKGIDELFNSARVDDPVAAIEQMRRTSTACREVTNMALSIPREPAFLRRKQVETRTGFRAARSIST